MSRIKWDLTGERFYETGVRNVVLFPMTTAGAYGAGVAWNGVTAISESPSGAESNPLYADDIKYLNLQSVEEYAASLEAYSYPDEFAPCNGSSTIAEGVSIGQQPRKGFGLCYRSAIGNDTDGNEHGYKLHFIYGCLAAPSEVAHNTINDSPEPATMSWEISTTPVTVANAKPTASLEIDSRKADPTLLAALEDIVYGKDGATGTEGEPRLPLPDEIATLMTSTAA